MYDIREISSLNYAEYAVQSVISICMGWCCEGGGRADQGRVRRWGGAGRAGAGGRDAAPESAQINISRCRGDAAPDRVPPVLRLPGRPRQPTTRLFNTCRIWDASFFMLNDRAA